jgi:hypothetical protein
MKLAGKHEIKIDDHSIQSLISVLQAADSSGFGVMSGDTYDDGFKSRVMLVLRKFAMETDEEYALRVREEEIERERLVGLEELQKKQRRYEQYIELQKEFGHE